MQVYEELLVKICQNRSYSPMQVYEELLVKKCQNRSYSPWFTEIFHMVVCLKIPFHPNQLNFGRDEFYFFFFFYFLFFLFFAS